MSNRRLKEKLSCKPVTRAEVEAKSVTRADLRKYLGKQQAATIDVYAASYLYQDENDLFDCRCDFDALHSTPGDGCQVVFLVTLTDGSIYVVDTQGYDYARYVGRLVD
jgi:hypothetical protein